MTLDSKLALQKLIDERKSKGDFATGMIENLNSSIESDYSELKSLNYLNWLGIDLFEDGSIKSIKRSNSSKLSRLFEIIISSVMILFFFISLYFWVDIIKFEFEILKLIVALILTTIGGFGLAILLRIIDRISFYKGFLIQKDSSKVMLKYKPNMRIEQHDFSLQTKLSVINTDNITLLNIGDNQNQRTVLKYKNLGTNGLESLKGMVDKFNN